MSGGRAPEAEQVLANFPKTRPALPPELQAIYARQYIENRGGATPASSLSQRLERWLHLQVARDVRAGVRGATLELGAGTLNQLPFEPEVGPYDIVEPFEALYREAPGRSRIRDVFPGVEAVPAERRYDRITSIASLEHICDLPFVLGRTARLLSPGGSLRAAIPAEGGLLWRLGWMLTTGLEFRLRHGMDYGVLMRHEHVNDAREIETLVRALFEDVEVRSFGLGRQLSLYRFIQARRPREAVAADWEARFAPAPVEGDVRGLIA